MVYSIKRERSMQNLSADCISEITLVLPKDHEVFSVICGTHVLQKQITNNQLSLLIHK